MQHDYIERGLVNHRCAPPRVAEMSESGMGDIAWCVGVGLEVLVVTGQWV